jgi:endoglucanase
VGEHEESRESNGNNNVNRYKNKDAVTNVLRSLPLNEAVDIAVAAVQEETGFGGSTTIAHSLEPGLAIAVDVTHATDAPGIDENQLGKHHFGSGPVIERGTSLHPLISELLIEAAEAEEIPYTLAASGRHTGTDADAIYRSRGGVPTGLVSVPLRYMHSPVEVVQLDDVENTAKLLAAFALRLPADVSFER